MLERIRIKKNINLLFYKAGIYDVFRFLQRQRMSILMYHRFSESPEPFKISMKTFSRQIKILKKHYTIIRLEDFVAALYGEKGVLPPNPLAITIDDGYLDNFEYAFPVLTKHQVPATIFLTTDFISQGHWLWANKLEFILKKSDVPSFDFYLGDSQFTFNVDSFQGWHHAQLQIFNYCRTLPNTEKDQVLDRLAEKLHVSVPTTVSSEFLPMKWHHVEQMYKNGVSFGSHSCTHPICSRLPDTKLKNELICSKQEIENHISAPVEVFCYPNGRPEDYSNHVIRQVKQAGYRAAVTTVTGFNYRDVTDPFRIKRLSIGAGDPAVLLRTLTRKNGVS